MKEIDWSNLSFGYMKTDYNVRINFREGEWGKLEISSSELINLHMADRKSTRLNSSHIEESRMPSSA